MTTQLTWHTESRLASSLSPNETNPRTISPHMKNELKKSMQKFNYVEPIVIDFDGTVICGSQRLRTLISLGRQNEEIEIRIPSRKLSQEEFNNYMLLSNRLHGEFDLEKLGKEFDLDTILNSGFDEIDLSNIFDDNLQTEDDGLENTVDELPTEIFVNPGDIYQLGMSRLIVGDSTDPSVVAKLLGDTKVHAVIQDPNFNQGLDYRSGVGGKAKYTDGDNPVDDNKSDDEYKALVKQSMETILPHTHADSHWFYFCSQNYIWLNQMLYKELGITHRRMCIWAKLTGSPTPNVAFSPSFESCVYGTRNKPFLSKKVLNLTEILNKEISVGNRAYDDILDIIDLWVHKRVNSSEQQHACQKPITLYEKILRRCTRPLDVIFDGFSGSGSLLLACEQMKRVCYSVEQHPAFAQLIINRYENQSQNKAIKVN